MNTGAQPEVITAGWRQRALLRWQRVLLCQPATVWPWWLGLLTVFAPYLGVPWWHYRANKLAPNQKVWPVYVCWLLPWMLFAFLAVRSLTDLNRAISATRPTTTTANPITEDPDAISPDTDSSSGIAGYSMATSFTPGYEQRVAAHCPPGTASPKDTPEEILEQAHAAYDQAFFHLDPDRLDCFFGYTGGSYQEERSWIEQHGAEGADPPSLAPSGATNIEVIAEDQSIVVLRFTYTVGGEPRSVLEGPWLYHDGYWLAGAQRNVEEN